MKVDMDKDYDKVDWSFLMEVLRRYGLNERWRQ